MIFDEKKYVPEESVTFKDENKGISTKRCPVTNFIRWRYASDDSTDCEAQKLREVCDMKIQKKVSEFTPLLLTLPQM